MVFASLKMQNSSGVPELGLAADYRISPYFCGSSQPVVGIIMLADTAVDIIAVAAIAPAGGLTLDDIHPMTHIDHSKQEGPIKIDRAF
jgi:hypothetical protein